MVEQELSQSWRLPGFTGLIDTPRSRSFTKPQSGRSAGGHTPADEGSSSILIYAIRHNQGTAKVEFLSVFHTRNVIVMNMEKEFEQFSPRLPSLAQKENFSKLRTKSFKGYKIYRTFFYFFYFCQFFFSIKRLNYTVINVSFRFVISIRKG